MKYFTWILLIFSFPASAQTMQGIVTDAATGKPMYPVTVVNLFTQQATSTDESGLYVISAKQGDVVVFSYIGYKTVKKIKPISVIIATVNIVMEQADIELDEFSVRPGLTQYQADSAERVAIYKVTLQRTHPNPFASPVGALAEKFSRKDKRIYTFQKIFIAGEIEKFIDTRYNPELVNKLTGLTGDSIGHFMYANPMPYDYARTATDLELKMWIRSNYKLWIKDQVNDSIANAMKRKE